MSFYGKSDEHCERKKHLQLRSYDYYSEKMQYEINVQYLISSGTSVVIIPASNIVNSPFSETIIFTLSNTIKYIFAVVEFVFFFFKVP